MDPIEIVIPIVPFTNVRGIVLGAPRREIAAWMGLVDGATSSENLVHVEPTTQLVTVASFDDGTTLTFLEIDWARTPKLFDVRPIVAGAELVGRRKVVERDMRKLGHAMYRDDRESTTYCPALGVLWGDHDGDIVRVAAWREAAYWNGELDVLPVV